MGRGRRYTIGFVRKVTGVQGQIDAANANAEAQVQATEQASKASAQAQQDSARAAADQQAMLAARNAAETAASDAASQPLETADVQLDTNSGESASATRRTRRAVFGKNYGSSSGVSI